jgi:hypothetical protein
MIDKTWPTDHLIDAERRLARLWNTLPDHDDDEPIELTDQREAILFAVADALDRARTTARQLSPQPDLAPLDKVVQLVGWVKDDLSRGAWLDDLRGYPGGYAGQIEEAIEKTWASWEVTERQAGRPPLTHEEAVADVAERLTWDRY